MEKKICSKCKEEKNISEFYIDKTKIDGLYSCCKICKKSYLNTRKDEMKTYLKKWKLKNPNYNKLFIEKNPDYVKNYYINNRTKMIDSVKKHYFKNKETILPKNREYALKYYYENIDIIKEKRKEYDKNNREKRNNYISDRKLNDPNYRLSCIVRNRVRIFLKLNNITKTNKTFDIVGCTPEFLKEHLEQQFTEGMSWDNQGKWHIDHKIPLSSAKTEEEIYKLCHYTNLQPLWAEDNLKKGCKILN
jgi:hypothetical protein